MCQSRPQIWNIEKEKERSEKEKVGDKQEEQHENFVAAGRK